mgnify:CR=1 FL=1
MRNLMTEQLKSMGTNEFRGPFNAALKSMKGCPAGFIRSVFSKGTPVICILRDPSESTSSVDIDNEDIETEIYFDNYWLEFGSLYEEHFLNDLNCKLALYKSMINIEPKLASTLFPEIDYYEKCFPESKPWGKRFLKGGVYLGSIVIAPSPTTVEKSFTGVNDFGSLSSEQKASLLVSSEVFRPLVIPPDITLEDEFPVQDQLAHWLEHGNSIRPLYSRLRFPVTP